MSLTERDQIYVEHMLECIGRIERYVDKDYTRFMQSEIVQDAVVRNLGLDLDTIWLVVEQDLPSLKHALEAMEAGG